MKWLASVIAVSHLPRSGLTGEAPLNGKLPAQGYGTDPDLNHPVVPWSRTMTAHQLDVTAVLADLILPGTGSAPAPSTLGIAEFVDEWISAPYPDQQADRSVVLDGLRWIDEESRRRWQNEFMQLSSQRQLQLLDLTLLASQRSSATSDATSPLKRIEPRDGVSGSFFPRFRFLVAGAYYTTKEGFKDIGYVGNVALPSYPPVTERERSILDKELRKLGIV